MRAVNLLPSDSGRSYGLPGPVFIVAAAAPVVAVGLVVGGYALEHSSVVKKRDRLATLSAQVKALPPVKDNSELGNTLGVEAEAWLAALDGVLADRVPWDTMLHQLAQVVPSDVWLTTLNLASPAVPGGTSSGSTANGLQVGGYTFSQDAVASVLQRLALLPGISNVTLSSSSSSSVGTSSLVQFQVTATIASPTAPATGLTPGATDGSASTSSSSTTGAGAT